MIITNIFLLIVIVIVIVTAVCGPSQKKRISPHRFKRITGRYPDCNTTQQAINLQYWDSMLWVHHKLTQRKNENSVSLPPGRWIQGCLYMLILGMMGCTDRGRGGWHKIVHARMGAHIYIYNNVSI
jgi:hypothetical protein